MNPENPYTPPVDLGKPPLPEPWTGGGLMTLLQDAPFPLRMSFRFFTLAPTVTVTDAEGRVLLFVRQQLLRLREQVEVYTDGTRTRKIAHISADRIIDWSARYSFVEPGGAPIGAMGRRGMRSLWRAHYDVFNPGDEAPDFEIREANPMAKIVDSMVGSIPLIGLLSLYLFHPKYVAARVGQAPVLSVTKVPAFLEGRFVMERLGATTGRETLNLILAFLMLTMLERRRG